MVSTLLFYIIAALLIFTSLNMILSTNLVHSALFMAATFVGIAFIYLLLNADYLAIVQIMVYVGAVSILFVFGVMLTKKNKIEESSQFNRYKKSAVIIALALFVVFMRTIFVTDFTTVSSASTDSTITAISNLLLNDYSIALEVSGILLLVALIGAITIGKGVNNSK